MIVRSRHIVAVLVAAALGVSAPGAALAGEALVAETPTAAPPTVELASDATPMGNGSEPSFDVIPAETFGVCEDSDAPATTDALAPTSAPEVDAAPAPTSALGEPGDSPQEPGVDDASELVEGRPDDEPLAGGPVAGESSADEPATDESAEDESAVDEPAGEEPTKDAPTMDEPAGSEPSGDEPETSSGVDDAPVTEDPDAVPDAGAGPAPDSAPDPAPDANSAPDAAESEAAPVPALIGWITQDGALYYYGSDGAPLLGERYLDGAWYFFDPMRGGAAATGFARVPIAEGSGSFKTAYYDASGKRVTGLQTIGPERYYFDENGALTLGFVEFGEDVDYFEPTDGTLQTGQQYIHGDWRNFEDDGAMSTGFAVVSDGDSGSKTAYYDEFDGAMQYGEQAIDGSWYLFDASTGAMKTGWQWVESGNKIAYYGADGRRYSGEHVIDGYRRYFDPATGAVDKYGFQNPLGYYQVSSQNVSLPSWQYATGFGYVTPSRIDVAATREDCVNAFIARAYEYIGTPYIWDYALAPGVGVDCAGLVLQCLYATGMDMGWYTPYDHYYTPGHDQYANAMASDSKFMHVNFADRQRGDLIFYRGHVGIYLGNDQIIDAYPDGRGVQVRNLWHMTPNYVVARPFV